MLIFRALLLCGVRRPFVVPDLRVSKTKQISAIPPSFHRAHLLQNSHDSSSIQHQRRVESASLVNG
jgi:hypothetical protein